MVGGAVLCCLCADACGGTDDGAGAGCGTDDGTDVGCGAVLLDGAVGG